MALRFFKIVVNPQDHMLRIPKEFIRRYGENLPDKVNLNVPSGLIREIGLLRSNGDTWFHKGWQEFQESCSIGFGHIRIFKFNSHSHFNVEIFYTTTVEIEYPGDAIEIVDDYPVRKSARRKRNTPSGGKKDMRRSRARSQKNYHSNGAKRKRSTSGLVSQSLKPKIKKRKGRRCAREGHLQRVVKESCVSYQKAASFMSENPTRNPFHILVMQPFYVTSRFNLSLPLTFCIENLPEKTNNVTLCVLGGKTWPGKCIIAPRDGKITCGWKSFVEDNDLKVGDACIFKVIKSTKLKWNVIIF